MTQASAPSRPFSGNPILPGLGVCDPHIRIFEDKAYLYATHDKTRDNPNFTMEDWWIWSSPDLVHWQHECTLKPNELGLPEGFNQCWATDAISRNGQHYWYLSLGTEATVVVVSDYPTGPWRDPLEKPLLTREDTQATAHDPGILLDDDGCAYLIASSWTYQIARLNDDMISLAEAPRKITIESPQGPVAPGKTDDKPTLHKRQGLYYLSWGCYYAIADNVYGPYVCQGSFIHDENLEPAFRYSHKELFYNKSSMLFRDALAHCRKENRPSTFDRHGSFFEWRGQWFFICNDMSQTQTCYFRDSVLAYVNYRPNGEIEPIRIGAQGVRLPEVCDG